MASLVSMLGGVEERYRTNFPSAMTKAFESYSQHPRMLLLLTRTDGNGDKTNFFYSCMHRGILCATSSDSAKDGGVQSTCYNAEQFAHMLSLEELRAVGEVLRKHGASLDDNYGSVPIPKKPFDPLHTRTNSFSNPNYKQEVEARQYALVPGRITLIRNRYMQIKAFSEPRINDPIVSIKDGYALWQNHVNEDERVKVLCLLDGLGHGKKLRAGELIGYSFDMRKAADMQLLKRLESLDLIRIE